MNEAEMLKQGKIGVVPTDTLYGLLASAFDEHAIQRVYKLKKRARTKKCIILISSLDDLKMFDILLTEGQQKALDKFWPGPVSVALPCGLAFRLPADGELISFLKISGPCIAPSANPEGLPPAETVKEAKTYFGDKVDFYMEGGKRSGAPSMLITLDERGAVAILRP